jgi:Zn finger protein HypA/HybF involved in hydrogenase expression
MAKLKKLTLEEIEGAIKSSKSSAEACRILNLSDNGGMTSRFRRLALKYNLDLSHWTGQLWSKGKTCLDDFRIKGIDESDIFSAESKVSAGWIRKVLKSKNIIEYKCKCGNSGIWNGEPMDLQLDHINGKRNDHRLENLRWICPNCHSQTNTFCGRNKSSARKVSDEELANILEHSPNVRQGLLKVGLENGGNYGRAKRIIEKRGIKFTRIKIDESIIPNLNEIKSNLNGKLTAIRSTKGKAKCLMCDKEVKRSAFKFCSTECMAISNRKVKVRPSKEELKKLLWEVSTAQIAKSYGVADHTIAKWAKAYDLDKPPRGYWAKQKSTVQSLSDSV